MTSLAMQNGLSAQAQQSLNLMKLSVHTPESLGPTLLHVLLTQAAMQGKLAADGTIEIPMTATISPPGSKGFAASDVCGTACIKILSAEVLCVQVCHHEQ